MDAIAGKAIFKQVEQCVCGMGNVVRCGHVCRPRCLLDNEVCCPL